MITLAKPIVAEHLVHVAADAVILDGNLRLPRTPAQLCCLLTEAAVADTALAIAMWHSCSTRRNWRLC
jgi:hypothetical protein